jgi:hypothetical protein
LLAEPCSRKTATRKELHEGPPHIAILAFKVADAKRFDGVM